MKRLDRWFSLAVLVAVAAMPASSLRAQEKAQEKIKAVASFSILADLVKNVGGDRVEVKALVGPNGDAHVYTPTPADARAVKEASVVVVNGLGLEGWMTRLAAAAGGKAPVIVATTGVKPLRMEDEHHPGKMVSDPHAWQSIANAKIYIANIRDGLSKADPAGQASYEANAKSYLDTLDRLETEVKAAVSRIPADRRRIITSHDAFGYFAAAYGMQFIAPQGVSTESEASARDVARIVTQVRREKIPAVFLENISDPRLMEQIQRETGAQIGGALFSDALSDASGPAPTYLDMMRNNVRALSAALAGS